MINANNKYYTPDWLCEYTIKKTIEIIGLENITEIIESSAGDGAFIPYIEQYFSNIQKFYYDILPEHPKIIKQDFKKLRKSYKKGRLIGFNPPFGVSSSLWKAFCKKASTIADYIVFISPASQYNSNYYFKEGELVYSELLNDVEYRGSKVENGKNQKVRTCLNIYKVYDRYEVEDWRYKRLEQDVDIHIHHPLRDGIDNSYDLYMSIINNCDYKMYNECPNITVVLVCKVKNIELKDKVKSYLQSLEKSKKTLSIPFLKEELKTFLYPTREERLEQDVLILANTGVSRNKGDYYISILGDAGNVSNELINSISFPIIIKNENIKDKFEQSFDKIKKMIQEHPSTSIASGGSKSTNIHAIKEVLIKVLYEDEFEDYPEVKKLIHIERAIYAKELF